MVSPGLNVAESTLIVRVDSVASLGESSIAGRKWIVSLSFIFAKRITRESYRKNRYDNDVREIFRILTVQTTALVMAVDLVNTWFVTENTVVL